MNLEQAKQQLPQKGFLDVEIDPNLDLVEEINKLRKEKNAIILAHYYQVPEIQDIANFIGDSLDLSRKAAATDAEMIVFAGVDFMAETAKILSPNKKVLIPDLLAGCTLSHSCPPDDFAKFLEEYPNHTVISYINCSTQVKALSDIICTSTNAQKIVESLPKDQPIVFAPDKNLGGYIKKVTGRDNMIIWNGACIVHQEFTEEKLQKIKEKYPKAKFIAHPECTSHLLEHADFIGSTSNLLNFVKEDQAKEFIVGTETGIFYQMSKACPDKTFIPAPAIDTCQACQECPYMKRNTLTKIYLALKYEQPEILTEENLRKQALKPIQKMLDISEKLGL